MMQFLFGLFYFYKSILAESSTSRCDRFKHLSYGYLACKYIANSCDARLVFELHDVWPQSLTEIAGLFRFNPLVILAGMAEKQFTHLQTM